jgi:hypothetical protein
MVEQETGGLRDRILNEMTVDYSGALEKNFDLAKQFIRITRDGKVDVLPKDRLIGTDRILLYLVGKRYAKMVEYADTDDVGNKELADELGIREGSLLPWLKELRDSNRVKQSKRGRYTYHSISLNLVEETLKSIRDKLEESD